MGMGQAKRREMAYHAAKAELLDTLQGDERIVAETSISLYERFVLPKRYTGGCYMTSMFLHRFLLDERGIATDPVVGYVNDGTDDIFMSHAWIEFGGRKVDLTLNVTEYQDVQLPGAVLILDHVLKPGHVSHSYHVALTPASRAKNAMMAKEPQLAAMLRHKAREHADMRDRAADPALMTAYLAGAPTALGYEAMRAAIV
jgi:hypothetical protein